MKGSPGTISLWTLIPLTLLLVSIPITLFRLHLILSDTRWRPKRNARQIRQNEAEPTHLLVVLGSGGHTAEMISMLERAVTEKDEKRRLDWTNYRHRTWVVGVGDDLSAERAKELEEVAIGASVGTQLGKAKKGKTTEDAEAGAGTSVIVQVPRARAIHQSLFTAPLSCLRCLLACTMVLLQPRNDFPDLILCNGPATATILVFASIFLRFFNVKDCHSRGKMRTVYVESWARVKKLSLSGVLLARVVDRLLVQWPQLDEVYGKGEYLGVLV